MRKAIILNENETYFPIDLALDAVHGEQPSGEVVTSG
jgi:hypothetical protein